MIAQITKSAFFSASAFVLFAGPVYAADVKPYVNIGTGLVDAENRTDFNGVFSGVFRGGVEISRYFALEGEGQFGLGKKTSESVFSDVRFDETTVKLNHKFGAYVVGRLPISDAVSLHARAGYAAYQSTVTTNQFFEGVSFEPIETTISASGASLGLGGQYMFGADKLNGIRLDGSIIIDVDESSDDETGLPDINGTSGVSIAYVRKF